MKCKSRIRQTGLLAVLFFIGLTAVFPEVTLATGQESLLTVTEEAQILPMDDGSGKYMLKSDGFYCLNADGSRDNKPSVHYFEHFVIDGTQFNGYYFHDETGKFKAGSPYVAHLKNIAVQRPDGNKTQSEVIFDGFYMVNNLGKLTAAPQVRFMDNLVMDGVTFQGYYYFDDTGKLITESGIHVLDMTCHGQIFDGAYYFGGSNGVLVTEGGVTSDGYVITDEGKLAEEMGIENLKPKLESMISDYDGEWSVYVKDLKTEKEIVLNDKELYSASLIKVFVMADTYNDMDMVLEHEGIKINSPADSAGTAKKVDDLLWNMITVSDNESFNELVRLHSEKSDFSEGAAEINEYLAEEGYKNTSVQHTLSPSSSASAGLGGRNTTSVKDCGMLLEKIYKGECISEEASQKMLDLLLNQQVVWKIPQGLPENIVAANKTGETDQDQHDIAIIYGEETTYILCVMSENCPSSDTAIQNIRSISRLVYNYLNAAEWDLDENATDNINSK